jgi:hypothetical protein
MKEELQALRLRRRKPGAARAQDDKIEGEKDCIQRV